MSFSKTFIKAARAVLPSPFTIAIGLTFITLILALFITKPIDVSTISYIPTLGNYWFEGMFTSGLLAFTVQMMLILVLGHIIALSKPINFVINSFLRLCKDTATAAAIITFLTILIALFNWGLGLVFGAIMARKIGEYAQQNGIKINYGLIGAAGYVGLMVWHGGISGSAPATVANAGHSMEASIGVISMADTVFSSGNIITSLILLFALPAAMFILGKIIPISNTPLPVKQSTENKEDETNAIGLEWLDKSNILGISLGIIVLIFCFYLAVIKPETLSLAFLNLNFIILSLLGLALLFHGSINSFLKAATNAIGGTTGILLQFPLYFGILGIMKSSGLMVIASNWMAAFATENSFPFIAMISAGIVNVFVPSGGGQWQVQGPILMETATTLNVSHSKTIMALAYGDQLTNMMQPFWALPLLGITGLKAKDILPYTLYLMLIGFLVFCVGLMIS